MGLYPQRVLLLVVSLLSSRAATTSAQDTKQVHVPSLKGYRLGQRWSEIGRGLPCRTDYSQVSDALRPAGVTVRDCTGHGDVHLTFVADTLFYMEQWLTDQGTLERPHRGWSAETRWDRNWKQWSVERFGLPDSVTTEVDSLGSFRDVVALWSKGSDVVLLKVRTYRWQDDAADVRVHVCRAAKLIRCVLKRTPALGLVGVYLEAK